MDYAQIINMETGEAVNLMNAEGTPYATDDAVIQKQNTETQVINGDIAFANNKQLLGVNATGQHRALLALRTYTDSSGNVAMEQVEVGTTSQHTNFNSIDRPTVEMLGHQAKEQLAFLSDLQLAAHEVKSIDLSALNITGLSGELSWILVHLSPFVSDISIWGSVTTDTTIDGGYHNVLTVTDEPLFDRFVGVVEKVALNMPEDVLMVLPYKYNENGLTIYIRDILEQTITFQDRLFLVSSDNMHDSDSRV